MKFATFALLAITGAVTAAPAPTTNQKVIHPNGNTAKCLAASSNADGASVVIEDCATDTPAQLWTVQGNTFQIFGDKCLDDTNGVKTNGQKMQIWSCVSGNTNQQWFNSGTTIGLGGTNKCLDNTDGKTDNGNPAQIWDCTGGGNQKWNIADATTTPPPPPSTGKAISPGKSAKVCLTAAANADNAAVTVQLCDNKSDGQSWNVTNGNVQIFGDKCLDVPNGSTTNGQTMQIYTCFKGNTNQLFTVTGDKRIAWTNKGECLDLTDGNSNPGTKVQMWKCTDNDTNQVWNIL